MSKALPFTKASLRRAIEGARSAGLSVVAIKPDGSIVVEPDSGISSLAKLVQDDPFVQGVRMSNATTRRRNARS